MRPDTDGWRSTCERAGWWTVGFIVALLLALIVGGWSEWVSIMRCLWQKECG